MDRLKTLTVSQSMAVIFFAGLSVAILFAAASLIGDLSERRKLAQDRLIVAEAREIGAVVHEMQRERGLTAAWLAAPLDGLREEVTAQRMRTDEMVTRARLLLREDRRPGQAGASAPDFPALAAWLEQARARADAGRVGSRAYRDLMTRETARLIGAVADGGTAAHSGRVATMSHALASLMAAKDAIGLERTIGLVLHAARGTPQPGEDRAALTAQALVTRTRLQAFRLVADDESRGFLDLWERSSAVRRFEAARADLLSEEGSARDVVPADWLERADAAIGALRAVETGETARLVERLDGELAAIRAGIFRDIALFCALLLLFGGIAHVTRRRVDSSIRNLIGTVCRLTTDASTTRIRPCPQRDLNQISDALDILRAVQIERHRSQLATEALRSSVDAELDRLFAAIEQGATHGRMTVLGLDAHGATLARGVNRLLDRIERDRTPKAS
ncbi:nitrate- and nitrite sensing domain-containing protein [Jannaschia formosa]|uniref:nitrate- and nitrite sensing domain-containing protein n=1 Tax=Jannaschia formosa TaxID=2259592 RepID=UPI000E1BBA31|nr:nitrate- and nitrite sensing domain-containing protein [Jannaschia formosa]TFL17662.1 hypothetical protein DR046_13460 [Jannaschia formosa]